MQAPKSALNPLRTSASQPKLARDIPVLPLDGVRESSSVIRLNKIQNQHPEGRTRSMTQRGPLRAGSSSPGKESTATLKKSFAAHIRSKTDVYNLSGDPFRVRELVKQNRQMTYQGKAGVGALKSHHRRRKSHTSVGSMALTQGVVGNNHNNATSSPLGVKKGVSWAAKYLSTEEPQGIASLQEVPLESKMRKPLTTSSSSITPNQFPSPKKIIRGENRAMTVAKSPSPRKKISATVPQVSLTVSNSNSHTALSPALTMLNLDNSETERPLASILSDPDGIHRELEEDSTTEQRQGYEEFCKILNEYKMQRFTLTSMRRPTSERINQALEYFESLLDVPMFNLEGLRFLKEDLENCILCPRGFMSDVVAINCRKKRRAESGTSGGPESEQGDAINQSSASELKVEKGVLRSRSNSIVFSTEEGEKVTVRIKKESDGDLPVPDDQEEEKVPYFEIVDVMERFCEELTENGQDTEKKCKEKLGHLTRKIEKQEETIQELQTMMKIMEKYSSKTKYEKFADLTEENAKLIKDNHLLKFKLEEQKDQVSQYREEKDGRTRELEIVAEALRKIQAQNGQLALDNETLQREKQVINQELLEKETNFKKSLFALRDRAEQFKLATKRVEQLESENRRLSLRAAAGFEELTPRANLRSLCIRYGVTIPPKAQSSVEYADLIDDQFRKFREELDSQRGKIQLLQRRGEKGNKVTAENIGKALLRKSSGGSFASLLGLGKKNKATADTGGGQEECFEENGFEGEQRQQQHNLKDARVE